ncbi:hypothetical protein [Neisseria sp. CCUG12390]
MFMKSADVRTVTPHGAANRTYDLLKPSERLMFTAFSAKSTNGPDCCN